MKPCLTCGLNHAPAAPSPTIRARKAEEALRVLRVYVGGASDKCIKPEVQERILDIISGVIE